MQQALGCVVSVNGSQAAVLLDTGPTTGKNEPGITVGKLLGIRSATMLVIGLVTSISAENDVGEPAAGRARAHLDLMGEIRNAPDGSPYFQRGVIGYPLIGDPVDALSSEDLRLIYGITGWNAIHVGSLQQDASIPAHINVDETLSKHFAVLGTTGVGKSSGVTILLREILAARPHLRIFLIDPHNEYGRSFEDKAQVLTPRNLKLPFWLFSFDEMVNVFFRARPGMEEEIDILSEVIIEAKNAPSGSLRLAGTGTPRRLDTRSTRYTVDTPVPYRIEQVIELINERMGKLENRSSALKYNRLITRIEAVRKDPRYRFMFDNANVGGDTMVDVLSQLFRLPIDDKPMTIMQLAGFPADVIDSVVSVLCRMAFEFGLWSDGSAPLLVVCEEAHRYAPADRSIGFEPARRSVSRIAKEGRKYGVYLGLITQRPAELDATIISQCSTIFAMRMANDCDQAIIRSAVSDAAASLLGFIPSLGTREVFAFGEGVALPTRLRFKELSSEYLPKSDAVGQTGSRPGCNLDKQFIASVVERWRGGIPNNDDMVERPPGFSIPANGEHASSAR